MDEIPGECNHLRMKQGEGLLKLKDKVLSQEGTAGPGAGLNDPCRSLPTQGVL